MHTILIIEDELDLAQIMKKRLTTAGYEVIVANDGYFGTKMAHEKKPDLVILDLMLPGGHGLLVLKNLRFAADTTAIPVIVTTGMKDEVYKQKVVAEGVSGFFEKPFDIDRLLLAIRETLEKK